MSDWGKAPTAMNIPQQCSDLRRQLDAITQSPPEQHPDLIAALRPRYSHTIELADVLAPSGTAISKFTCFMYAFDLVTSVIVGKIASESVTCPGSNFVAYLADQHLTELPQSDTSDGDVVIYSNSGGIEHAGTLTARRRIVSKWGDLGHLWEHAIEEVPSSYGDEIRFYRAPGPGVAEEAFEAYARQREGSDHIDLLLRLL